MTPFHRLLLVGFTLCLVGGCANAGPRAAPRDSHGDASASVEDAGSAPDASSPADAGRRRSEREDGGVAPYDAGTGCTLGETRRCYEGDPEQAGIGQCHYGTQTCVEQGEFGGRYGPCTGSGSPAEEICDNDLDENCDGTPDDGCATYGYGAWTTWDLCSEACGGGEQTRTRPCLDQDGTEVDCELCGGECEERRSCNEQVCEPTTCGSMTQWQECSIRSYVDGVHGDDSSPSACADSCGEMAAGCAKYIQYPSSAVCVCHDMVGIMDAEGSFAPDNRHGWSIHSANCF
jgi:hypothetical protein